MLRILFTISYHYITLLLKKQGFRAISQWFLTNFAEIFGLMGAGRSRLFEFSVNELTDASVIFLRSEAGCARSPLLLIHSPSR